jgi:hypothetical protein
LSAGLKITQNGGNKKNKQLQKVQSRNALDQQRQSHAERNYNNGGNGSLGRGSIQGAVAKYGTN